MDPVEVLRGDEFELAVRLAAADSVAVWHGGKRIADRYAGGIPDGPED